MQYFPDFYPHICLKKMHMWIQNLMLQPSLMVKTFWESLKNLKVSGSLAVSFCTIAVLSTKSWLPVNLRAIFLGSLSDNLKQHILIQHYGPDPYCLWTENCRKHKRVMVSLNSKRGIIPHHKIHLEAVDPSTFSDTTVLDWK